MTQKPRVIVIESPYAGQTEQNLIYARRCVKDALMHNEAPLASHLLYAQPGILNGSNKEERDLGMACGHAWIIHANYVVVYTDYGISEGMQAGIKKAENTGTRVYYRKIGLNPDKEIPAD